MVACPRCASPSDGADRFCRGCGEALAPPACRECGAALSAEAKFCAACGKQVIRAPLSATRSGAKGPAAEERRWVTVLFADLSGFTSMSERLDPEDVRVLVDSCLRELCDVVDTYGGVVDKLIGDCVMAVWGAPTAHGDDAERAVRAGLAMLECRFEKARTFGDIALSIGINTGEAMYGRVGGEAHAFTVVGDTVNTASRLQSAAGRGGILIGADTYAACRHGVVCESVGPVSAKGKAQKVDAWRPLAASSSPGVRPLSSNRLVGRDTELAALDRAWSEVVKHKSPRLVTVLGAMGVGKSKLVRHWLAGLTSAGAVLHGRSLPYGDSAYGAYAEQVATAAGIFKNDDVGTAMDKLERLVTHLAIPDAAGTFVADIAAIAGLTEHTGAARSRLFAAASTLVEAAARRGGAILVFEDAQCASPGLLDLVEHIATHASGVPLLLLTVARSDLRTRRPTWPSKVLHTVEIPVGLLDDADCATIARNMLAGVGGQSERVEQLAAASAGNPLFLEELIRGYVQGDLSGASQLPSSVRSMVAARLDALPPEERSLLLDASVVGLTFWEGALVACGHSADRIGAQLEALEAHDLINRVASSRIDGDREYVFRHELIRDVGYSILSRSARKESHRAVMRFVRERAVDRTGEIAPLLAHHAESAGDTEAAIDYLLMSAHRAATTGAGREARELYSRALALAPKADPIYGALLLVQRAQVAQQLGDHVAATKDLDEALPHLHAVELVEAQLMRAWSGYWLSEAVTRQMLTALTTTRETSDTGLVASGESLGMWLRQDGQNLDEARAGAERIRKAWPADLRRVELVRHLALTAHLHDWSGDEEAALARAAEAEGLAAGLPYVETALLAGSARGLALLGAGRHGEAIDVLQQLVATGVDVEAVPLHSSRAMTLLAEAYQELLDLGAAAAANATALELAAEARFTPALLAGKLQRAMLELSRGELITAEATLGDASHVIESLPAGHAWSLRRRSRHVGVALALARGDVDEAGALAEQLRRERGSPRDAVLAGMALAASRMAKGEPAQALAVLDEIEPLGAQVMHPPTLWQLAAARGRALRASGASGPAEAAVTRARALATSFAARLSEPLRAGFTSAFELELRTP